MKKIAVASLVLGAFLAFGSTARADEIIVRTGGHYETRCVTVSEPGHWTTVERRVWVPATTVMERRERVVPTVVVRADGCKVVVNRTVCETVPVTRGGYYTTVCDRVWVEGCTHEVERRVWVEDRACVRVEPRVHFGYRFHR